VTEGNQEISVQWLATVISTQHMVSQSLDRAALVLTYSQSVNKLTHLHISLHIRLIALCYYWRREIQITHVRIDLGLNIWTRNELCQHFKLMCNECFKFMLKGFSPQRWHKVCC